MTSTTGEKSPRQAVVLIHGIGEQRPMETLRGFVSAFLKDGTYHSKPDLLSDTFELRRLKLRKLVSKDPGKRTNADWPETDFYEYYWAHQMYGTTISHVFSWLFRVMIQGFGVLRSGDVRVHARLRWLVPLVWLIVVAIAVCLVAFALQAQLAAPSNSQVGFGAALLVVLWAFLRPQLLGVFTDFAGDAARYFDINPRNVMRRYAIIRGGVEILRKLHTERDEQYGEVMYRYGRVVLLGHSLGSVIAYDILKHYWQEVNGKIPVDPAKIVAVEGFCGNNGEPVPDHPSPHHDADRFRRDQHAAWRDLNRGKPAGEPLPLDPARNPSHDARWLISDLVTLGSPLTYAPLLMAKDIADLDAKIKLRELPSCPPDRSHHLNPGHFTVKLSAELERLADYDILPQSAQFATVRWTNFFFKNDPIGGPLGSIFGPGIDDRPLDGPPLRPITAHIGYWNKTLSGGGECVGRLESILKNVS